MNDKNIINTISKLNFIILSAVLFIFLTLSTIFVLLQNGIFFDDISISNIKAKKLYIKWNENINVIADEITIIDDKTTKESNVDYTTIITILSNSTYILEWFEEISINKLFINDSKGSLSYKQGKDGLLTLSSKEYDFKSSLGLEEDILSVKSISFNHPKKKLHVKGDLEINNSQEFQILSSLNVNVDDDAILNIYAIGDKNKLSYNLSSKKDINNTKAVVDLFDMNPRGKYWVYDAMEMSSFSLKSAKGWIDYNNLSEAYKNIHVNAVANDLIYTYDKKVDSVRTDHTNLEFKDGVLFIRPQDAYSYNFFLDKSWLKIDFSKQEELLTLFLKFKGKVNNELLSLLNRYEIKLPFKQTQGEMDTDLKLEINLRTTDVEAKGDFKTKKAQINYLGLDIDIFDATVYLTNSHVTVNNMFAKYKDIASAHVDLDFNGRKSKGKLDFRVDKVLLQEPKVSLVKSSKPLHVKYIISDKQDLIEIEKSSWATDGKIFKVAPMKIPFDMKTLSAKVPSTSIDSKTSLSASLSGKVEFKPTRANLDLKISHLNYNGVTLEQPKADLRLKYDKELHVSSVKPIKLNINKKKYTLDNIAFNIDPESISAKQLKLDIDNSLKCEIDANYNIKNNDGFIDLINIKYVNEVLGELLSSNKKSRLFFHSKDNMTYLTSKKYDFNYISSDEGWKLRLGSLDKVFDYSKFLNKYSLNNGSFSLEQSNNSNHIDFTLESNYKYKVLAQDNKPIDSYILNGAIDNKTDEVYLKLNNKVDILVKDNISIKAKDIGINLYEILNLLDDKKINNDKKKSPKVLFESKNSHIYFSPNRSAISESLNIKYFNKLLTGELIYKKGTAHFKMQDDHFHLFGGNFNDEFMGRLFSFSKFKGGSLEFSVNGSSKEYVGTIYTTNTTIRNYKILNNVLAFVNTIPSLVTFSLPGYNTKGIKTDSAYINFSFKDEIYKFSDIALYSKEIDILGKGEASLKNNTIDLDLNLKTDLGSSLSKVPLVGYILLGDESISSSLTVTGSLDDPDVNTQVAKDIVVAPLNIIKRTLMLPYELFRDKEKK